MTQTPERIQSFYDLAIGCLEVGQLWNAFLNYWMWYRAFGKSEDYDMRRFEKMSRGFLDKLEPIQKVVDEWMEKSWKNRECEVRDGETKNI